MVAPGWLGKAGPGHSVSAGSQGLVFLLASPVGRAWGRGPVGVRCFPVWSVIGTGPLSAIRTLCILSIPTKEGAGPSLFGEEGTKLLA